VRPGRFAATIVRASEATSISDQHLKGCAIALLGLADDTGIALNHGRTGAHDGPRAFRAALAKYGVETPSHPNPYPRVFDAGDIVPRHDIHETHARVTEAVEALLDRNLFPIAIGGGHDLTFPFVRAIANRLKRAHNPGRLSGVYLDAHLDVRAEVGSGMPFRRLIQDCGVASLTCVGLDRFVNSAEHVAWFREHGGILASAESPATAPACFKTDGPLFVSIDLDCLDVAHAPGVSAINPNGLSPAVVANYAYHAGRTPSVKCFDIMELSPAFDPDARTARLAAHLFLNFLQGFGERM